MFDEAYLKHMASGSRPIPGQSLTDDPDNPGDYERPPQFVELREALEHVFMLFTHEDYYEDILEQIMEGIPIIELVQVFLFEGFRTGKWNPDLMMLLAEPATYMLMALAERAGIDYVIDNDPETDPRDMKVPESLPKDILTRIEEVE